jgi:hypothetical protein
MWVRGIGFEKAARTMMSGAFMVVRSVRRASPLIIAVVLSACPPAATSAAGLGARVEPVLDIPRLDSGVMGPASTGVRFGHVPPGIGSRWSVSVEARSVSPDPQGGRQFSEYLSSYTVEVLAMEGPAPSRVRLAFAKNVHRYQGNEQPTAIDGKTYVVEASAPHVRDDSGSPAPEDAAQRVLDIFPDLGTRTQIDQVLPDAAMAIGDARHELAGAILGVIHPRAWTLNQGTAVLARVENITAGDEAVFALTIDATGRNGLRMDVKGEARVRLRDARLSSITLDGTYAPARGGERNADEPEGVFSLRRRVTDL